MRTLTRAGCFLVGFYVAGQAGAQLLDISTLRAPKAFLVYLQPSGYRNPPYCGTIFTSFASYRVPDNSSLVRCNQIAGGCPVGEAINGFWGIDTSASESYVPGSPCHNRCDSVAACKTYMTYQIEPGWRSACYLTNQTTITWTPPKGDTYRHILYAYLKNLASCPCPARHFMLGGICTSCKSVTCEIGQYAGGCAGATDSVCEACTQPTAGQFVQTTCSAQANTVTAACKTTCPAAAQYISAPCLPGNSTVKGADSTCSACTCPIGTFALSGCTGSSPPACNGVCSECVAGQSFRTAPCTLFADGTCTSCRQCAEGSFTSTKCGLAVNSACTACEPSSYKPRNAAEIRANLTQGGSSYTLTCPDGQGLYGDFAPHSPAGNGALVLYNTDGSATLTDRCVSGGPSVHGGWSPGLYDVTAAILSRLTGVGTAITNSHYNNVSICYDCYSTRELWQPYVAGPVYDRSIRELEFQCVPGYEPVIPVTAEGVPGRSIGGLPSVGSPPVCNATMVFARCTDVNSQISELCSLLPLGAYASSDACAVHRHPVTGRCSALAYGVESSSHRLCQPNVLDSTGSVVTKKCYALGGDAQSATDSVFHGVSPITCKCKGVPGAHSCSSDSNSIRRANKPEAWTLDGAGNFTVHSYTMPAAEWVFDPASPENRGQVLLSLQPYFRLIDGSQEQFYRVPSADALADLQAGKLLFQSDNTDIRLVVLVVDGDGAAVRLDEDVDLWFGASIALYEKNPDAIMAVAITRSTGNFSLRMRFQSASDPHVGAMRAYWTSLGRWSNKSIPMLLEDEFTPQWGLRLEWLYRRCDRGEYQVGDSCFPCQDGQCLQLSSQVAFANGTTPCAACSCGIGPDAGNGCQECNKKTCGCSVRSDNCLISDTCYVRFDLRSASDGCVQCRPDYSQSVWTALTDPTATCDDGDLCTHADSCASGVCTGTPLGCLSFNLTGDVTKACEICGGNDGCVPDPSYSGCVAVDTVDPLARSCGCNIDGVCYPHGAANPDNLCEECNVALDPVAWSAMPPVGCDDGQLCTHSDTCQNRQCSGLPYTCDIAGVCLTSATCNGRGTCDLDFKPPGTLCAAGDGVCRADQYCDGASVQCPPKPATLPIIIPGNVTVVMADMRTPVERVGSLADRGSPYLDALYLSLTGWSVACGSLDFTVGWYTDQSGALGCSSKNAESLLSPHGAEFGPWAAGQGTPSKLNLVTGARPQPGTFSTAFAVPLLTALSGNGARILDSSNASGMVQGYASLLTSSWVVPVVKARNIRQQEVEACVGNPHQRVVSDDKPPAPRTLRNLNPLAPDDGVTSYNSHSGNHLAFSWLPFTTPSRSSFGGALKYQWCVGLSPGTQELVSWKYAGVGATSASTASEYTYLPEGIPLYVTVRGSNRVGLSSDLLAGPFTLDSTPATGCTAFDGQQMLGQDPVQAGYAIDDAAPMRVSVYGCADSETAISAITTCWGTLAGSCDVTTPVTQAVYPTQAVLSASLTFKKVPGIKYIATVRVISGSGAAISLSSPGVILDLTPPEDASVRLPQFTSSLGSLNVQWTFTELESVVTEATLEVLGSNGAPIMPAVRLSPLLGATGRSIAIPAGVLQQGSTYSVCAVFTNAVGLSGTRACASTTVDVVPVTLSGMVMVHPNNVAGPAVVALGRPDTGFAARWESPVPSLSGVRTVAARLVTSGTQRLPQQVTPGDAPASAVIVIDWTPVLEGTLAVFKPARNATPGWTYWITLRIIAGSELATVVSAGVFVDDGIPPGPGAVWVPIPARPQSHSEWWGRLDALSVSWRNMVDLHTGPAEYWVAVGQCTIATVSSVMEWTNIGSAGGLDSAVVNVSLAAGDATSLCVSIRGVSNTGATTQAMSPAFRLDISAPNVPFLNVAAVLDYDAVPSADGVPDLDNLLPLSFENGVPKANLTVTWPKMEDTESDMAAYFLCRGAISHCDGNLGSNVLPASVWNAGLQRFVYSQVVTGLPNTVQLHTICGMNNAGLTACITSDGIRQLASTSMVGYVAFPASSSTATLFASADGRLPVALSHSGPLDALPVRLVEFPAASAVQEFLIDLGTQTAGASEIYSRWSIGRQTQFSLPAPPEGFMPGLRYCLSVSLVLSETNIPRTVFRPCFVLDFTPPNSFVAEVGTDEAPLVVAWPDRTCLPLCLQRFGDEQTGIARVTAAIGTSPWADSVSGSDDGKFYTEIELAVQELAGLPASAASTKCFTLTGLSLRPGIRYTAAITATNNAGMSSRATTASFYVDDTPPSMFDVIIPSPASAAALALSISGASVAPAAAMPVSSIITQGGSSFLPVYFTATVDAEAESQNATRSFFAALGSAPGLADVIPFRQLMSIRTGTARGPDEQLLAVVAGSLNITGMALGPSRAYLVVRASSAANDMSRSHRESKASGIVMLNEALPTFTGVPRLLQCATGTVTPAADATSPSVGACDATSVTLVWQRPTVIGGSLLQQRVCLRLASGSTVKCVEVGPAATSAHFSGLTLTEGAQYDTLLTATSNGGGSAISKSALFSVDTMAPVFPSGRTPVLLRSVHAASTATSSAYVLPDSAAPVMSAADIDAVASSVTVMIPAASESGSGLARYDIAFGTVPGGTDLMPFTAVQLNTSSFIAADVLYWRAPVSGARLVHASSVYTTVRAVDNAGNAALVTSTTGPVAVVRSPSALGMAVTNTRGTFQSNASAVSLAFIHPGGLSNQAVAGIAESDISHFAVPTGVASYHVCITSGGPTDTDCTNRPAGSCWLQIPIADATTYLSCDNVNLQLVNGVTYTALFRVTSRAGLSTTVASALFGVDVSAPLLGTAALSPQFGSTSSLRVDWQGFSDPFSGIASVDLRLVQNAVLSGNVFVSGWVRVSAAGAMDVPFNAVASANFTHQDGFSVLAHACDLAGNCADGTVSGSQCLFDATAPVPPSTHPVRIVASVTSTTHLLYLSSAQSLTATWGTWLDQESPIVTYMVAVGVTPGGQQVLPYRNVGLAHSVTLHGMALQDGMEVYVTVTGISSAGLSSPSSSLSSRVVLVGPLPFSVYDGDLVVAVTRQPVLANMYGIMNIINSTCTSLARSPNRTLSWCVDEPQVTWNVTELNSLRASGVVMEAGAGLGSALAFIAGRQQWDISAHSAPFSTVGCHWGGLLDLSSPLISVEAVVQRRVTPNAAWTDMTTKLTLPPSARHVHWPRPRPILQGMERCVVTVINAAGLRRTSVSDGALLDRHIVTVSGVPRFLPHPESSSPSYQKGDKITVTWNRVFTAPIGLIARVDLALLRVGGRAERYLATGWDITLKRSDWPTVNCTNTTLSCTDCLDDSVNSTTLCANRTTDQSATVCMNVSISVSCPKPPVYEIVPDAAGWISYGPTLITAELTGLMIAANVSYVPVVRAMTTSGTFTDMVLGRASLTIDNDPMQPRPEAVAVSQSLVAYQTGRVSVGIARLGYLSDPQLVGTLVSLIDGSAENVTIPNGTKWSPVLTANLPLMLVPVGMEGKVCPYTNRPFEVHVAAQREGASNTYRTVPGSLGSNHTIVVSSAWVARAIAEPSAGLLHGSMCAAGSYRSVFGTCVSCPPGSFKAAIGEDSSCRSCGSMTWWQLHGQQVGFDFVARSFKVSVANFASAGAAASTAACACLDYSTQEFDAGAGACVCKAGRYVSRDMITPDVRLDPNPPQPPSGRITGLPDDGLCSLCPAGQFKAVAGNAESLCLPCPAGMASTADGAGCQCTDANQVWNATASTCVCKPGLYLDAATCVACPGGHRFKDLPGNSLSACLRCPFGTLPDASKSSCQSAVPGMLYEHRDGAVDNAGYCPAGTRLEYLGQENVTLGGMVWVYRDPAHGYDDWIRSRHGAVCYLPKFDDASGDDYFELIPGVARLWEYEAVDKSVWATRGMKSWNVGEENDIGYDLPFGGPYSASIHGPPADIPQFDDFTALYTGAFPRHRTTPAFTYLLEWLYNPNSTLAEVAAQRASRLISTRKAGNAAVFRAFSRSYPSFSRINDSHLEALISGWIDATSQERLAVRTAFLADADAHMYNYSSWKGLEAAFAAAKVYYARLNPFSTDKQLGAEDQRTVATATAYGEADRAASVQTRAFTAAERSFAAASQANSQTVMTRRLMLVGTALALARGGQFDGDSALLQVWTDLQTKISNIGLASSLQRFTSDNSAYADAYKAMDRQGAGLGIASDRWVRWASILRAHITNIKNGVYQEFPAGLGEAWTPVTGPGIYSLSRTAPWCSVVRQRPLHRCTPCAASLVQPTSIAVQGSPFTPKLRSEGQCRMCPLPGSSTRGSDAGGGWAGAVNYFLVANLTSLHLDWSALWTPGDVSGPRQFLYALGSVPGGSQYLAMTAVEPPTATRVDIVLTADRVKRLGLQHGAPIYATVQAVDVAGNLATHADTNPVVWDPNGPLPGDVKDATLDSYTPPPLQGLTYRSATSPQTKLGPFARRLEDDATADNNAAVSAKHSAVLAGAHLLASRRESRRGSKAARSGAVLSGAIDSMLNAEAVYEGMYHKRAAPASASRSDEAILSVHAGQRAVLHRRRLQFGTLPDVNATGNSSDPYAAAAAAYAWRDDGSLTDIMFVPDLDFQTDPTRLSVSYEAFGALASGIAGMSYCVGSQPYACDIMPATLVEGADGNLPTTYSFDITGLNLAVPSTAYVSISAASGSGIVATVTTDGIKVDNRPPYSLGAHVADTGMYALLPAATAVRGSGAAAEELSPAIDIDCDAAMSGVGASWSGFVAPLGLARYEWCVGTRQGRCDMLPWTSVGLATSVYNATLLLPEGAVFFSSVRVIDRIGQSLQASSDGVRLLAEQARAPADETPSPANSTGTVVLNATEFIAGLRSGSTSLPPVGNATVGLTIPVLNEHRFACNGAPADFVHLQATSTTSSDEDEVAGMAALLG